MLHLLYIFCKKHAIEKVTIKDFPELDLGGVCRDQRVVTIIDNIIKQPACSILQQNSGWYETKAAYQFFRNEYVTLHYKIAKGGYRILYSIIISSQNADTDEDLQKQIML